MPKMSDTFREGFLATVFGGVVLYFLQPFLRSARQMMADGVSSLELRTVLLEWTPLVVSIIGLVLLWFHRRSRLATTAPLHGVEAASESLTNIGKSMELVKPRGSGPGVFIDHEMDDVGITLNIDPAISPPRAEDRAINSARNEASDLYEKGIRIRDEIEFYFRDRHAYLARHKKEPTARIVDWVKVVEGFLRRDGMAEHADQLRAKIPNRSTSLYQNRFPSEREETHWLLEVFLERFELTLDEVYGISPIRKKPSKVRSSGY